jgi:choline dehydrogenase-like flavoprotein
MTLPKANIERVSQYPKERNIFAAHTSAIMDKLYDVVIVGSGAGGGMASKILTAAGLKVALMEAGGDFDPAKEEHKLQMKWPYESPRRGAGSTRPFGDFDANIGGWDIEGEPYTQANGSKFDWWRARMMGGRTNHWGRISLRFGPQDFKRKDHDGQGENWPIGYDDVKPYYDKVDKLVGVFGTNEGLPNDPDGFFLPPPKPRLNELMVMKGAGKVNIPVIPSRMSMLTMRINDVRGACFYCGQCSRACSVYADFSAGTVLVKPAHGTGKLDIFLNAMVRKVETDAKGLATGVVYIDKADGQHKIIKARAVVLAASACESARILLNSKSKTHPNGLANSSGVVGKYLHDSTGADRMGIMPSFFDRKRFNEDGVGGLHVYTPWWLGKAKNLNFSRGYHIEYWGRMGMPAYGSGMGMQTMRKYIKDQFGEPKPNGGYGSDLRNDIKTLYGASVGMSGRGESIPRETNYCELDPNTVDKYGIPVLRFNYQWSDQEVQQARHMQDTFEDILTNMGAILLGPKPGADTQYGLLNPGRIIHEVGTTRMGNDPKKSVLNAFGQAHDCKNLFVVDGGSFVSQADKNPTWTILALSWRTSDYIVEQFKQRNI